MKGLRDYPLRVSRGDAIAIVNRGGDYVVHAAQWDGPSTVYTVCGRQLHSKNEHSEETGVSCGLCLRGLRARERNF